MRLRTTVLFGFAVMFAAHACGGGPPPAPAGPDLDSLAAANERARQDSIRAAQAAEAARRDSLERARRAREAAEAARRDSIEAVRRTTERVRATLATMINFDYDRAEIRPNAQGIMDRKLAIMRANTRLRIRISGHCDDRGSDEYNLALGNRRAQAAKRYLVDRGIAEGRIMTESLGEERPLDQARNETAWARNRRDEFSIVSGGDMLTAAPGS